MVESELRKLIELIRKRGCEAQVIEVKSAHGGCPEKLYDTFSAFSNQNDGGTFVFGLDENKNFEKVGVYNAQELQKKVMEYGEQMTPVVRPVFTVYNEDEKVFVSAEIPPVDIADRPCFKTTKGRLQGSYIRVGDADKPMTEYEVYSYEAFRKKYRDDIRAAEGVTFNYLDQDKIREYLSLKREERPNLAFLSEEQQMELAGITKNNAYTITALLLFGIYPQGFYPQLSIIATCVPGIEIGDVDQAGNRFIDSKRIEGTLPDMLEGALAFVRKNMKIATRIDKTTGRRNDIPQYPLNAIREAILNALVHRDYSFHTEGMPIQLNMFTDRLEIENPGGLYGRMTVDQLGNMQPDTRNPVLVTAMETLRKTENRYSGIPTIRHAMRDLSLPQPVFCNSRGVFKVVLYNNSHIQEDLSKSSNNGENQLADLNDEKGLLEFCRIPRSRAEIIEFMEISSGQYALRRYLDPLIEAHAIQLTIPDKPRSPNQKYVTVTSIES